MKGKRNALGRGLGALLEDSTIEKSTPKASVDKEVSTSINSILEVELSKIKPNPYQPRTQFSKESLEELADSIKVQGIIQPVTLRKINDSEYHIISGERRVRASELAGLEAVPAYIREATEQQMLELALIENIQREDLNAIEIAISYQRLIAECGLKLEELGDRVGKKRSTVNNYLRLLKLPPEIQVALREKKISMGHARAIINIDKIDLQLTIFKKIITEDLSVRKVEQLVREIMSGVQKQPSAKQMDPEREYHMQRLQKKLSSHFGTKVNIKADSNNKGEIKIPFLSSEDFNRIMELLNLEL
ncbi:ParB/RepB/Spo0J family partition protein [Aureibacter tunicatorum]|uniref:ParB family chromosome partitioning protein n=1 Tax=Aureibacter tunicatorum TaxID=866807 RepID=A0AAE3XR07_9BACT|nr:ParB/RepB/Spo0J family partition protein [Aureibacter tunicatorum]MDR6239839.1 ParB family chromosome partitioning protein [Aureibacter tunicatorum]BDD04314.1 chromosome partitioning protein ParB [Aureibacter tunicatorum]